MDHVLSNISMYDFIDKGYIIQKGQTNMLVEFRWKDSEGSNKEEAWHTDKMHGYLPSKGNIVQLRSAVVLVNRVMVMNDFRNMEVDCEFMMA